jgi:anaerobic selenocysteine-containing dehydrogenase
VRKTPEWAAPLTGVDAATIRRLALEFATTKPAAMQMGYAPGRTAYGEQAHRTAYALAAITGNVGIPGGGVNFGNWPWAIMHKPVALDRRTAAVRTVPVSKLAEALQTTAGPPITTALFMGTNLVNQMPDTLGTQRELAKLDFRVCVDQFLTDTAECADVFLPSTTMLEEEDFLPSYGHLWMQLMRPVVAPQGEARSDLVILQALADRLGFGPDMAGSAAYWIDQLTLTFRHQGISHASLKAAGGRLWPGGDAARAVGGRQVQDADGPLRLPGRVRRRPRAAVGGLSAAPHRAGLGPGDQLADSRGASARHASHRPRAPGGRECPGPGPR